MKLSYVWRVQNKNGRGPYISCRDTTWMDNDHNDPDDARHPRPPSEFFDALYSRTVGPPIKFCFTSIEQARGWFSEAELERLKGQGFHLTRVRGRLLGSNDKQAWFEPETS